MFKDIYDSFIRFDVAFSNAHSLFHPLRQEDGTHYRAISHHLKFIGNEQLSKRTASQVPHRNSLGVCHNASCMKI